MSARKSTLHEAVERMERKGWTACAYSEEDTEVTFVWGSDRRTLSAKQLLSTALLYRS